MVRAIGRGWEIAAGREIRKAGVRRTVPRVDGWTGGRAGGRRGGREGIAAVFSYLCVALALALALALWRVQKEDGMR